MQKKYLGKFFSDSNKSLSTRTQSSRKITILVFLTILIIIVQKISRQTYKRLERHMTLCYHKSSALQINCSQLLWLSTGCMSTFNLHRSKQRSIQLSVKCSSYLTAAAKTLKALTDWHYTNWGWKVGIIHTMQTTVDCSLINLITAVSTYLAT